MKKRIYALALAVILLFCFTTSSLAAMNEVQITPVLSYTGTTANCMVTITEAGKYVDATLTLKYGSIPIDSWQKAQMHGVSIYGTAHVTSGHSYTLEVSGTIDGIPFSSVPVTVYCP